ncbi:MAG TPA: class I tRNA ligase family protein, partial [Solirubrobacterales bacterium]|nr:class I tRNA ligase family protein [Solirubrobacterales bacterium]
RRVEIGQPAVPVQSANGTTPRPAVRYRAGDFAISRQRSWGAPIPIVHCDACGEVPVPMDDLPVRLPRDLRPTGEGNPLAAREDFMAVDCPRCGAPARRETDTLDCHFDDLWMWLPTVVPKADRAERMFDHPECARWLPGAMLIHGADGGGYFFDQRITAKALRDIGPLDHLTDGEQFAGAVMHEMVTQDGRKMSKHLGNVVDPDELVAQHGADTVRLAVLYAAGPAKTLNWSDGAVRFASRFLRNLWKYTHQRLEGLEGLSHDAEAAADTEHMRDRLRKWCENGLSKITEDTEQLQMHKAIRNITRLFERIQDFEKRVIQRRGELGRADAEAQIAALVLLARTLVPFAPHIAEELLVAAGVEDAAEALETWPEAAEIPVSPASAPAS